MEREEKKGKGPWSGFIFLVSLVCGWEALDWFFLSLPAMFIMKEGFILPAVTGRLVEVLVVLVGFPEVEYPES